MLVVALTTMLAPLNSTMIAVALPRITRAFDSELAVTGWLVTGYLIVMASIQPVAGKLGDRFGRRWFMLGGLLYFAVASLGAATAANLPLLIFFRLQQALAGALALPNGTALVRELVSKERRASRFGMIGAVISLAAAGGPPLGGLLVKLGGWQAIFFVNLVFILPALLLGSRIKFPPRIKSPSPPPFDHWGALSLAVILVGVAWLNIGGGRLELDVLVWIGAALLALGGLFVHRTLTHPDPVLQIRFFRSPTFVATAGGVCLSNFAMYTTFLSMPVLLPARFGWGEAGVGLALTTLFASNIALAPLGGWLADRWGRRWPTVAGMLCLGLGLLPLALAGGQVALSVLLGGLAVAGVGVGLSSAGLQSSAVESVAAKDAGVASGVFSTSRYLGSIVGSSVLAGMVGTTQDPLRAIGLVFVLVTIAAFAAMALCVMIQDRPESESAPQG